MTNDLHSLNVPSPAPSGLLVQKDTRDMTWEDIRKKPLKAIIDLNALPRAAKASDSAVSFAAAIRGTNNVPLELLPARDLFTLTSDLLIKLHRDPGEFDLEYLKVMKLAWQDHAGKLKNKIVPLKDMDLLNNTIERVMMAGKHTTPPLKWFMHDDLEVIAESIQTIKTHSSPLSAHEIKEDQLLAWAHKDLKGARIKQFYINGTIGYTIELPHQADGGSIIKYLHDNGSQKSSLEGRMLRIVPIPHSPLAAVMENLFSLGREKG